MEQKLSVGANVMAVNPASLVRDRALATIIIVMAVSLVKDRALA